MRATTSLVCIAVLGAPAHAEEDSRTLDVGAFAGVHAFGGEIELGNSWADEQVPGTAVVLGGRAGLTFLPDLAPASAIDPQLGVEGELALALASTGESMDGGRRSYFAPVFGWRVHAIGRVRTTSAIHPHLVVGVGGESVVSSSPFMGDDTDALFYWGPGLTWRASPAWIARVDLRHGLTAGRTDAVVSTFEVHLGVERRFGRRARPRPEPEPPPPPEPVVEAPPPPPEPPPDPDVDGDGFPLSRDACPAEPEDVDQFQDDDGCPDPDDDGDGIADAADQCRGVPETFNGFEDTDGCPDELPKVVAQFTGTIEGINFAYSSARIQKSSWKVLDEAAKVLRDYPDLRVRIEGHTDPKGKLDKNVKLSFSRAEAVKWYLVDQGIAADRIETVGHGPDKPRASNETAKGRAQNRRIEFHLIVDAPAPPATPPSEPPATQPSAPAE